jgi:ABC-type Zn uptake system ZnuABC Zn-binding protein ZnuA
MKKLKLFLIMFVMFVTIAGCQAIKEKTNAIVEKENEKLSKYISKPASVLQMD